jgi:hypothetical protein
MFTTAKKRGKKGSRPGSVGKAEEYTPATMYSAVEFGGKSPDSSRRMTNNYGKTSGKRNENNPEVGEESRRKGRMFNWMKGDSY